jgi:hypothetical protein
LTLFIATRSVDYNIHRARVAALEKQLWSRLKDANYEMLNEQPRALAELDKDQWRDVCAAFQSPFPELQI